MFRKMLTTVAAAAIMMSTAHAGPDGKDAGPYEMWSSLTNESRSYAIVNHDTGKTVAAEIENGKSEIFTGADAKRIASELYNAKPEPEVIHHSEHKDVRVITDGASTKKVIVMEMDGDSDTINIDEILKEHDIELTGDGEKKVIIKKHVHRTDGKDVDVDIDIDVDELIEEAMEGEKVVIKRHHVKEHITEEVEEIISDDGEGKQVKRRIKIMGAPDTPEPPTPPSVETSESRTVSKYTYRYEDEDDGKRISKEFTHLKGVDAKKASDFIGKMKGVSRSEKSELRKELGL